MMMMIVDIIIAMIVFYDYIVKKMTCNRYYMRKHYSLFLFLSHIFLVLFLFTLTHSLFLISFFSVFLFSLSLVCFSSLFVFIFYLQLHPNMESVLQVQLKIILFEL